MSRLAATLSALAALATCATIAVAQDGLIPHAQDRPPNPPKSPAEAVAAMTVPEGFAVEVVAAEPDLINPVAMTIDEKGRFWVTESLEYPRREPGPGRDRVKVLEDTDGDGKVDQTTIFAEGLNIPSGIAVGHGGVWVANSPDILFYPNADGDLVPDGPPQVVATGFGRDDTHELPNSLTWGPDGWLYGWNGVFNPSKVASKNGRTYAFTCAVWRINPVSREFQVWCEGTSNPWGIAVNDDGELFASACVIDHLWHLVEGAYYIRQGGPYPPHTWPMDSIVDHNHQKAAYCGIHWFDSDAYPEPYRKLLYMGNIHGNCINVDALERSGSTYKATARPDFLSANDAWFMPVSQKTGPDGSLYILDWYDRYHCYQDANRDPRGIDRLKGRLYRVRYQDTPRAKIDLAARSNADLTEQLNAGNDFLRATARRLLVERALFEDQAARFDPESLRDLILDRDAPRTKRLEALWVVASVDAIREALGSPGLYARLMDDADPTFRAWASRTVLAMPNVAAPQTSIVWKAAVDPAALVRLQVAIGAAKHTREVETLAEPIYLMLEALKEGEPDSLLAHVAWQRLVPMLDDSRKVEKFLALAGRPGPTINLPVQPPVSPALASLMPRAVERLIGADEVRGEPIARAALAGLAMEGGDPRAILDTLTRKIRDGGLTGDRLDEVRKVLGEHVRKIIAEGSSPFTVDYVELAGAWGDPDALARLRRTLAEPKAHPAARSEALDVLAARRDPAVLEVVGRVLSDPEAPEDLRDRVLNALGALDTPEVAPVVLSSYDDLAPGQQLRAVELLSQRPAWSKALVAAVEAGKVPKSAVNVNQIRRMQDSRDGELAERTRAIWGTVREGYDERRAIVVGTMRNFLRKTPGDPFAGEAVFNKVCAQCHKIYGEGQDVGPEITLNGRNDFEQLVSNVFDPSLVIGQGYQATTVATVDGRVLTGLVAEDSPERIVLKIQGGKVETLPRAEIEEMKTSPISLMPEDMESQLTPQEIADLFAYLALDRPPEDPEAKPLPGAPPLKRNAEGR